MLNPISFHDCSSFSILSSFSFSFSISCCRFSTSSCIGRSDVHLPRLRLDELDAEAITCMCSLVIVSSIVASIGHSIASSFLIEACICIYLFFFSFISLIRVAEIEGGFTDSDCCSMEESRFRVLNLIVNTDFREVRFFVFKLKRGQGIQYHLICKRIQRLAVGVTHYPSLQPHFNPTISVELYV